jgi:hypothetical protein
MIADIDSGSGGGSGGVEVLFHTGSGQGLSPLVSPQAPGTNLINGHTAPMPLRPHTAHCLSMSIPQAAPQFLVVVWPQSGITTLIRVRGRGVSTTPHFPPRLRPPCGLAWPRALTSATPLLRPSRGEDHQTVALVRPTAPPWASQRYWPLSLASSSSRLLTWLSRLAILLFSAPTFTNTSFSAGAVSIPA